MQEDVPIRIDRVDVVFLEESSRQVGLGKWLDWLKRPRRTSESILQEVIEKPLYGSHESFKAFYREGETVLDSLRTLGGFDIDAFEMAIEPFDEQVTRSPGEPVSCLCRVSLKENKRLGLGAKLSAEGESAVGETELKMTNYFGFLERISGSVAGSQGQTMYHLSVEKPVVRRPYGTKWFRFGCGNTHTDNRALSSHSLDEMNIWASYVQDEHNFTYEGSYRDVKVARKATERMLREGGHSIKSAVRYTFQRDGRDHRLMPSSGSRLRLSAELAGLFGDVRHAKFEADYNKNWSFNRSMAFQFISRAGLLFQLNSTSGSSHIADRYFFGGLSNPFWGFKMHGAGPRLAHDSLGGDAFWTTSFHANAPITSTPIGDLYAHAFTQAGNCVTQTELKNIFAASSSSSSSSPSNSTHAINYNTVRLTAGAGLAFTTSVGLRFDAIYAVPLMHSPSDLPQTFTFGASFNFG